MPRQEKFSMVVPKWLKEELERIARKKGISLSEAIKDMLKKQILLE